LNDHTVETRNLSVAGGGVGACWSDVRGQTKKSPGSIPFIKTQDTDVLAYHQGQTRRGAYAAYMDVGHPDIVEFINIRKATGGDANRKALNIHNAVVINQAFLNAVRYDESWYLINPDSNDVVDKVIARDLYKQILTTRHQTGEPYIMNSSIVSEHQPMVHKNLGLKVKSSNLCAEITLPSNKDRTAVCCLSSLNIEKYDEWVDTDIVADLVRFLDNVLQFFIENADPKSYAKSIYSAKQERSIGIGALGFHSYLQSKGIPFESALAVSVNHKVFKNIKQKAEVASVKLGEEKGFAGDYLGQDVVHRRNTHLLAVAPNASSSIIAGTSPSIEPWKANCFLQKTASGSFLVKNKYLETLLDKYYSLEEKENIWKTILGNGGSVQHLTNIDEYERDVFKTAIEINQNWVVSHAVDRQNYICQSQSLNLFFPPEVDWEYLHQVHWKAINKLKSLYYLRTEAVSRAENVGMKIERMSIEDEDVCLACEG